MIVLIAKCTSTNLWNEAKLQFYHFQNCAPTPKNYAQLALKALFHHCISKFGSFQKLIAFGGTEYFNSKLANYGTPFKTRHSTKISHAPLTPWSERLTCWSEWTCWSTKKITEHTWECFRMILLKTGLPECISLLMLRLINFNHLCNFHLREEFFIQKTGIPPTFQINRSINSITKYTARNCSKFPPPSHYQSTESNSLFNSIMLKPICAWFFFFGATMLQLYSIVFEYALQETNSLAKTKQNSTNVDTPLPLISFIWHWNIRVAQISD